jgi:hypothetical protein
MDGLRRGRSKKVVEGGMGEEEKERRRDTTGTSLGNKRPSPKSKGVLFCERRNMHRFLVFLNFP